MIRLKFLNMSGHLQNKVGHFDGVSHAARQIPTNKNILLVVTWFQPIWFFFARQKWESSPSRGKHNKNMFELPAPRNPCFGVCTGLEWAALPPLLLQAWTNIKMSCFSWIYPPPPHRMQQWQMKLFSLGFCLSWCWLTSWDLGSPDPSHIYTLDKPSAGT